MAVTFLIGRAGAGKTHHCLSAIAAALAKPADRDPLILLVPEQASFQMERALAQLAPGGGFLRAQVLSFTRLARRVLDECGIGRNVLEPRTRALVLRTIVERCRSRLTFFADADEHIGFIAGLDRTVGELLRENVSAQELASAAARLDDPEARARASDLAVILAAYEDWLGGERIDPAQQLAALRSRIGACTWLHAARLWVDGFAGFTGQETATLTALARAAQAVQITLLLDPQLPDAMRVEPESDLFARPRGTHQRLRAEFAAVGVDVAPPIRLSPAEPPRFVGAPDLARLEAALAGAARPLARQLRFDDAAPLVRVLNCPSHREELRQAARQIRAALQNAAGGLRFRDFAVIVRDLAPLAPLITEVFDEYELPYFLDQRRPLLGHPLHRLIECLFEAAASDAAPATMIRLLRTDLLPLRRSDTEELENLVIRQQVQGLRSWLLPEWSAAGSATSPRAAERAARLFAGRRRIVAALQRIAERNPMETGHAWAQHLLAALDALRVPARLERWCRQAEIAQDFAAAETHRLAWQTAVEVLEQLHDVLGTALLSFADVSEIVGGALRDATIGLAPPTLDQVLVASIERSRHPDVKFAWIIAFNEGLFPARRTPDALLPEESRAALRRAGVTLGPAALEEQLTERLLAYIAATRPSRGLTISYAQAGEDGEPREPSPLLADVLAALPGLRIEQAGADDLPVSLSEFAWQYLAAEEAPRRAAERAAVCAALLDNPATGPQVRRLVRGQLYANRPDALPQAIARAQRSASFSELSCIQQCPFKHFSACRLRLDAERGPESAARTFGELAHDLLARATTHLVEIGKALREVGDDEALALLTRAEHECSPAEDDSPLPRSARFSFLQGLLLRFVREVWLVQIERWRRGSFLPMRVEAGFGNRDGDRPALRIQTPHGALALHGRIDRVDARHAAGERHAIVYDYKSKAAGIRAAILTGHSLQLLSYALALPSMEPRGLRVLGVLAAPLYPSPQAHARDVVERDRLLHSYLPRGLVAQPALAGLAANPGELSRVVAVKLRNDGRPYQKCDAVAEGTFDQRVVQARRTLEQSAEALLSGSIDIAPLLEGQRLACQRCAFRPLCRYDRRYNQSRVAEDALPPLDAAVEPDA